MENEYKEQLKKIVKERMLNDPGVNCIVKYLCNVYMKELEREIDPNSVDFLFAKHFDRLMLDLFRSHFSMYDSTVKLLVETAQNKTYSIEVKTDDSNGVRLIESLHRDSDGKTRGKKDK
jgi:hypothetical protein